MIIFFFLFFAGAVYADPLLDLRKELEQKSGTESTDRKIELLNVSYDPTREFYDAYNKEFVKWWKEKTGQDVFVVQSHGGSGKQARAVISGLEADVVSLALAYDIDAIQKFNKVIGENWQGRLPNNSSPYFSTIVFLVRKGNPKGIKNWDDLAKEGITVVTPNPKTSGGARWTYLAAWAFAMEAFGQDKEKAKEFMVKLYGNVPVLDAGARASTTTFIQRKTGDVLLTWENEAYLTMDKTDAGEYEIVYPSLSIRAEPPVTWVEVFNKEKGTSDAAQFYLKYLYSVEGQKLAAKYHYRPFDEKVAKEFSDKFPNLQMVSISDFGGWEKVQKEDFSDGGVFDEIFLKGRRK